MKKMLSLAAIVLILSSCGVNPNKGKAALEGMGITDIQITGYSFFGCSKDDSFRSNFVGTGPNGNKVSGTLCSGFLKGITVRFD